MPFIVILVLMISLFVLGVGMKSSFSQPKEEKTVTSQKITNSSRAEIEAMLKQIETKNAPKGKMGAMCYDMAAPPEYQEYVCPLDGEKTVFNRKDNEAYESASGVVEMRRLVERLNSITNLAKFNLDEKRLCHICSPDIKSNERYIALVTKYPDGKEYRYDKISNEDLTILVSFFDKKLNYEGSFGEEIPLKKEIGRIRKLLGTEIEKNFKEDKK